MLLTRLGTSGGVPVQRKQRDMQLLQRAWVMVVLWMENLRLAGRSASKASASTHHVADGAVLTNDESKLHLWAEHFKSLTQCSSKVSQVVLEALLSIQAPSQNSPIDNEEMCSHITEEEVSTAR